MEDIKQRYDTKREKRTGVMKWLQRFSGTILYYSNVLDVLAQHHPEYLCLAWGSVKFVLQGIIVYAELVEEFAQALAIIGEALRQTKLSAELFKTEDMQAAISRLYAHIILFLQKAVNWYKRGLAARIRSAIFKPYKLEYQDTVEQIKLCARTVDDVATSGNRAEVRDMNITMQILHTEARRRDEEARERDEKLHAMQLELKEMQVRVEETVINVLQVATCNKAITESIHVDVSHMKPRIYEIEFSQILSVLKPKTCPHEILYKVLSIATRSNTRNTRTTQLSSLLAALGNWMSTDGSSLFLVKVGPRAEAKAKEFAADVVKFLQKRSIHVIWNIAPLRSHDRPPTVAEVLKGLVFQLLQNQPTLLQNHLHELNFVKIGADHTDAEWAQLLRGIFTRLSKCFVVVEAQDLFEANRDDERWAEMFLQLFQGIVDDVAITGSSLKILVVGYGTTFAMLRNSSHENRVSTVVQRPTMTPVRLRRPGNRMRRNNGWERLQPKI
ncbi:hypothetical protein BU16DRAFT_454960 [Lophium mytilinum]|uniref:DUF7708 domain-containing protein n=1 Tax=Lophium mytilinum TaxID=390894 RepID=A0A6A6R678_9PEZI|nr:hypothetical protein BU16DRAFT_454960 [Lophium mytilinum]